MLIDGQTLSSQIFYTSLTNITEKKLPKSDQTYGMEFKVNLKSPYIIKSSNCLSKDSGGVYKGKSILSEVSHHTQTAVNSHKNEGGEGVSNQLTTENLENGVPEVSAKIGLQCTKVGGFG